jgi:hypothetical protein
MRSVIPQNQCDSLLNHAGGDEHQQDQQREGKQ